MDSFIGLVFKYECLNLQREVFLYVCVKYTRSVLEAENFAFKNQYYKDQVR